eukprot:Platyproteum_vivax@DN7366_c0_g1_i5.p1
MVIAFGYCQVSNVLPQTAIDSHFGSQDGFGSQFPHSFFVPLSSLTCNTTFQPSRPSISFRLVTMSAMLANEVVCVLHALQDSFAQKSFIPIFEFYGFVNSYKQELVHAAKLMIKTVSVVWMLLMHDEDLNAEFVDSN